MTKLEREAINALLARYRQWMIEEPMGLLPASHPRGIINREKRQLIIAAKALHDKRLAAQRKKGKK